MSQQLIAFRPSRGSHESRRPSLQFICERNANGTHAPIQPSILLLPPLLTTPRQQILNCVCVYAHIHKSAISVRKFLFEPANTHSEIYCEYMWLSRCCWLARRGNIIFWHNATLCVLFCVCKFLPLIDFGLLCVCVPLGKKSLQTPSFIAGWRWNLFSCISLKPQFSAEISCVSLFAPFAVQIDWAWNWIYCNWKCKLQRAKIFPICSVFLSTELSILSVLSKERFRVRLA